MKVNQLKAGVILSYLTMFLSTGISIFYTPLMLNLLGQSEYGLYQLVASVVSYLSLLTLGFGGAYVRFYSRYKGEKDENGIAKLNGMFLTVFSIIGVIVILCGGILVANVENIFEKSLTIEEIEIARILMIILVINVAVSMPASVFNSFITANECYFYQKVLRLIKTLLNPFLMITVLLLGFGSVGMVVVTTVLNITLEIAYVIYAFKNLNMQLDFKRFNFPLLKEIAIFSSFIFMNIIIDQINWNVDKFLLGMFQGTSAVAVYAVASQLKNYYISFGTAISSVFIPRVNKLVATEKDTVAVSKVYTKVGRLQFSVLALILSGLIIFGKDFICMWAGEEYSQSYYVMLWLVAPITVSLIKSIGVEIRRAQNLHKTPSLFMIVVAFINVAVSIPLAKAYGAVGCAIGTGVSIIINAIFMEFYYAKVCKIDTKYYWKSISSLAKGLIIPVIVGLVIFKFVSTSELTVFLIAVLAYVGIYVLSMWFLGFNQYEKNLVLQIKSKVLKKGRS